ncbi:MAG TPA: hypothetical protein VGI32_13300 [Steroidobacteraceae bacterium]|jgi:hypothetical protein
MPDRDAAARDLIRNRLAQSREELRVLLDPPAAESGAGAARMNGHSGFPRSRTMQMLMSSRGLGTLGALAGGLLIARPALALRLLRLVPTSAVAKMLMARAMSAFKAKPQNTP